MASLHPAQFSDEDAWKQHDRILPEYRSFGAGRGQRAQPLKMFMSAREIQSEYQPLDADKIEHYDFREGETTSRRLTTEGNPNATLSTYDKEEGFAKYRENTGDKYYRQTGHTETDTQLWDRKLEESQLDLGEYKEVHGGGFANSNARTPGWNTLMERGSAPAMPSWGAAGTGTWEDAGQRDQASYFHRKQDAHRYASGSDSNASLHEMLGHAMRPGGEGFTSLLHMGTQFGSSGKPQVVGGHHRIAAMADIEPDRLLPVVHSRDVWDARKGFGNVKYD